MAKKVSARKAPRQTVLQAAGERRQRAILMHAADVASAERRDIERKLGGRTMRKYFGAEAREAHFALFRTAERERTTRGGNENFRPSALQRAARTHWDEVRKNAGGGGVAAHGLAAAAAAVAPRAQPQHLGRPRLAPHEFVGAGGWNELDDALGTLRLEAAAKGSTMDDVVSPRRLLIEALANAGLPPLPMLLRPRAQPSLDLQGRGWGDDKVCELARCVGEVPALRGLNVCNNRLTARSLLPLMRALAPAAMHLSTLDLSENKMDEIRVCNTLAHHLGLRRCGLKTLKMRHARVNDRAVRVLLQALCVNTSVTALDLSHNLIGGAAAGRHDGGEMLATMLKENFTLVSLDMAWNHLAHDSAIAVGRALEVNDALTALDVSYNALGDRGAQRCGWALRTNTTLRTLNLSHNGVADRAAIVLAGALRSRRGLPLVLKLRGNPVGAHGGRALLRLLSSPACASTEVQLHDSTFDFAAAFDVAHHAAAKPLFDAAEPSGTYRLDLADAYDRTVALELCGLAEAGSGCRLTAGTLNGQKLDFGAPKPAKQAAPADGDHDSAARWVAQWNDIASRAEAAFEKAVSEEQAEEERRAANKTPEYDAKGKLVENEPYRGTRRRLGALKMSLVMTAMGVDSDREWCEHIIEEHRHLHSNSDTETDSDATSSSAAEEEEEEGAETSGGCSSGGAETDVSRAAGGAVEGGGKLGERRATVQAQQRAKERAAVAAAKPGRARRRELHRLRRRRRTFRIGAKAERRSELAAAHRDQAGGRPPTKHQLAQAAAREARAKRIGRRAFVRELASAMYEALRANGALQAPTTAADPHGLGALKKISHAHPWRPWHRGDNTCDEAAEGQLGMLELTVVDDRRMRQRCALMPPIALFALLQRLRDHRRQRDQLQIAEEIELAAECGRGGLSSDRGATQDARHDVDATLLALLGVTEDARNLPWPAFSCGLQLTAGMAQRLLRECELEDGGMTRMERLKSVMALLPTLINDAHVRAFVHCNVRRADGEAESLRVMMGPLFGPLFGNPTGHYEFDLANPLHRVAAEVLARRNNEERWEGRVLSGRRDTSQFFNWDNFRNALFMGKPLPPVQTEAEKAAAAAAAEAGGPLPIADGPVRDGPLPSSFFDHTPRKGVLSFDFASTRRPPIDAMPLSDAQFEQLCVLVPVHPTALLRACRYPATVPLLTENPSSTHLVASPPALPTCLQPRRSG